MSNDHLLIEFSHDQHVISMKHDVQNV